MDRRVFATITAEAILFGLSGCLSSSTSVDSPRSNTTDGETATREENDEQGTTDSKSHDHEGHSSGSHGDHRSDDDDDQSNDHDDHSDDDRHGDDDAHHHDAEPIETPTQHADMVMVSGEGHHFEPHLVWVEAGGSVTWTNESGSHTATAYHEDNERPNRLPPNAATWDSGLLETGQTFEQTFDVEGVYDYFCLPREGVGIVGSVVVGDPDPNGQPALEPPQETLPETAQEVLERSNQAANETLGHTHG